MKAEYIDHMGDDLLVVNAARVSFNKEHLELLDNDIGLIKYLSNNGHWTPFSHPQITVRETVPIFVARQRFKHMVGFTYNEVSRRYVDDEPEFYRPKFWRKKAENKKQGSSDEAVTDYHSLWDFETIEADVNEFYEDAQRLYNNMLVNGVAPEQARMVLPQSMYTSYYVTGSLAAWARAFTQRSHPHSQLEIQELASQWDKILRPLFPVSWNALSS